MLHTKPFAITLLAGLIALGSSSVRAEFDTIAGWDHQLFPSYIVSTATARFTHRDEEANSLGDPNGLLGVKLTSPKDGAKVTVTISCDDILDTVQIASR